MKVYISDFNGVLTEVRTHYESKGQIVYNPREADVFVLWQDVRSEMSELCRLNEEYLHKPVVIVQHGRGATRDYLPPNKFKMYATKFCCWGPKEKERLDRAGYGDRAVITGSPIAKYLIKRSEHEGKNVIFCPVITQHEEPENIDTFIELKKIELTHVQSLLRLNKDKLKESWDAWNVNPEAVTNGSIPYYNLNRNFRVISKLTGIHDKQLYFGDVVSTLQNNKSHIGDAINLLSHADCVVGHEEGTFQLLAMAMDIPIVMVEGFSYKNYGGIDYSSIELIRTDGVRWTDLEHLEETVLGELTNPDALSEQRKKVVAEEFGDTASDSVQNIIQVIEEVSNG